MTSVTAALYEQHRPLLFAIAYRMLGTVGEAEDVVQDAFVRYTRAVGEGTVVGNPKAYLTTTATRLALDLLTSARRQREAYVGEWLPEPLLEPAAGDGPAETAELRESVSMAFLVMLESLNPIERAVFLLRDVFGYGYGDVAAFVDRTEDNCRQILVRARTKVQERRPRYEPSPQRQEQLASRFLHASRSGDLEALKALLAEDVSFHGDGGGKVPAVARAVQGRDRVLRLLVSLLGQAAQLRVALEPAAVNGQPGIVNRAPDGTVVSVFSLQVAGDRIVAFHSVINPDKLRHLGTVADARALRDELRAGNRMSHTPR